LDGFLIDSLMVSTATWRQLRANPKHSLRTSARGCVEEEANLEGGLGAGLEDH